MVHFRDVGAREAAEAANRVKSELRAVMSHELRTPLNAIGGYAQLLELGLHGPITAAQRTALDRIQRRQRHLLGLVVDVLDFSRLEAGAVRHELADVPVAEAVAEAKALLAPQLHAEGLGVGLGRGSGAAAKNSSRMEVAAGSASLCRRHRRRA